MSSKKGQSKKIDSARRAPSRRGLAGYSAPRRKTPEGRYVFTLYGRRHAARQKTPKGRHIFTLYKRRHRSHTAAENAGRSTHLHSLQTATPFTHRGGKRRKASLSPHFTTPTPFTHRGKKRRKADTSSLFTNGDAVHTPRRKTPEDRYVFTLYGRRHAARRKTPEGRHIFTLYKRRHRSHTAAEISDSGYNSTFCKRHLIQQKKRRMTACPPIPPKNLRRPLITPKNTANLSGFSSTHLPGTPPNRLAFGINTLPPPEILFLPLV